MLNSLSELIPMEYLFEGVTLIILLIFSAFFSGSEAAIFHLPRMTIEKLATHYRGFSMLRQRERLLPTILIGNNLVNTGASILAARIFYLYFHIEEVAIVTGVMTYIILVFAEFYPKLYSLGNAEKVTKQALPLLKLIRYILLPITAPINAMLRLIGPGPSLFPRALIKREELKVFVEWQAEEGLLTPIEQEFILRVLDFRDKKVADIMTKVDKIEALPTSTALEDKESLKLRHSRIPVYKRDINHIVGILYVKDLLSQTKCKIAKMIRKPYFVMQSMSAKDLFSYFQQTKVHIAIVIDEHKKTKGVVTLDDVLNTIIK